MSTEHPHSKLITVAARDVLRPLGLTQKGRSRTWIDDQGWWLGVVEFQPSSWSRGTYLNVGPNFLWIPKKHLSFDIDDRVVLEDGTQFVEFESEGQFAPAVRRFTLVAAERITQYRRHLASPRDAASYLASVDDGNLYRLIHAGIAFGVSGETALARQNLDEAIERTVGTTIDWVKELHDRVSQLRDLVGTPRAFRDRIRNDVDAGRELLRLPNWPNRSGAI